MMVGALLTKCDCDACDAFLPVYSGPTTLLKEFTGTNRLSYINYTTPGVTGPIPTRITTFDSSFECTNNPSMTYGITGPLSLFSNFSAWSPTIPPGCQEYFITTGVHSTTQASVSWSQVGLPTIGITMGGYNRPFTNTILVTGGIPIKRYIYQYNLSSSPSGSNNQPAFSYDIIAEPITCCSSINKTFPSVTGGSSTIRSISTSNFNTSQYGTIYLRFPGLLNATCYGMTITFANNPTNNAKTWTANVNNGFLTFTSSAGDVAGPYNGTLNDVASNIASNSTWFSGVSLNPYLALEPSTTKTFATTDDLPNWTSPPFQRSVNGTTMGIPLAFANYNSAPSTYDCGFYTQSGLPFFGTNYSRIVGTFSYDETVKGFSDYLKEPRYAKKSSFIANNPNRGLYYTNEYDSWLQLAEGTNWSRTKGSSTHTQNYNVKGLTCLTETFNLNFLDCYVTSSPPNPKYGNEACDFGDLNGPEKLCPSNAYWTNVIYDRFAGDLADPGVSDCSGNYISPLPCVCPPGPCPGTNWCRCGNGSGSTSAYPDTIATSIQTLSGSWQLT